jgi:hypothetical protein
VVDQPGFNSSASPSVQWIGAVGKRTIDVLKLLRSRQ